MTVRINTFKSAKSYYVDHLEEGCAYTDEHGTIYICNRYKDCVAFSLCGSEILTESYTGLLTEVDLEVNVKVKHD